MTRLLFNTRQDGGIREGLRLIASFYRSVGMVPLSSTLYYCTQDGTTLCDRKAPVRSLSLFVKYATITGRVVVIARGGGRLREVPGVRVRG